jgi:hypothetical protein
MTAWVADRPTARKTTIKIRELKWYPNRSSKRQADAVASGTARVPKRRASISTASRMPR